MPLRCTYMNTLLCCHNNYDQQQSAVVRDVTHSLACMYETLCDVITIVNTRCVHSHSFISTLDTARQTHRQTDMCMLLTACGGQRTEFAQAFVC